MQQAHGLPQTSNVARIIEEAKQHRAAAMRDAVRNILKPLMGRKNRQSL